MSTPRLAAARATANSPSGWMAWAPVGEMITGIETDLPITVVAMFRLLALPATCGAKPSWSNESRLSFAERPFSEPATMAPYTDVGRCFCARRWATATVSNHLLMDTPS